MHINIGITVMITIAGNGARQPLVFLTVTVASFVLSNLRRYDND